MVKRPKIPLPLQRRVRQQCAFGCVFCGKPVFEYDHIIEYSKVKCHEFDNLVLLCRDHHGPKTHHCLNIDLLRAKRLNPYNRDKSISSPREFMAGNNPYMVIIGDNIYGVRISENIDESNFSALTIGDQNIISITFYREGGLIYSLPSINIRDENQETLVLVSQGEIQTYENDLRVGLQNWDISCANKTIVIRSAPRKILLSIEYNAGGFWLKRATLYDRQETITVNEKGVHFEQGGRISGQSHVGCLEGLTIC
ncbi:MAG: HNH endonuclease [Alphaproteobacteria bacterium]|nr:HNH endonuclease [Alphaproteobacteria bacterium]